MLNKTNNSVGVKAGSKVLGALAVVVSFCSFSAAAQGDAQNTVDARWFIGNPLTDQAKNPDKKEKTSVKVTNVAVDDSRNGWQFDVEFGLSENFAIGAAYVDMKDVDIDLDIGGKNGLDGQALFNSPSKKVLPASSDGFTLQSRYHYNLNDNFGLTGSIGLFNWEGDSSTKAPKSQKSTNPEGGTDLYFGLGGGYQLTEDMILEINWEHYKLDNDATEMWSIGVNYHFR